MARHRITCINKPDRYSPYKHITHIGGVNTDSTRWKLTEEQAIIDIENGKYEFYVHAGGRTVDVIVATSIYGHKYLKTTTDGEKPDNLLSLPECN